MAPAAGDIENFPEGPQAIFFLPNTDYFLAVEAYGSLYIREC